MMRSFHTIIAATLLAGANPEAATPDSLVLVSTETLHTPGWSAVAKANEARRPTRRLEHTTPLADALRPALRRWHPRHVCLVARPEEVSREYVALIHPLLTCFPKLVETELSPAGRLRERVEVSEAAP